VARISPRVIFCGRSSERIGGRAQCSAPSRAALKTCRPDENVSDVVERNVEGFDFLPVVEMSSGSNEKIVGLLSTKAISLNSQKADKVGSIFRPLSEELVIGADSSILEFVSDADSKPCRLVVSGARIEGLVSLSDLQKLPVRAALCISHWV
jgi:CBS domain